MSNRETPREVNAAVLDSPTAVDNTGVLIDADWLATHLADPDVRIVEVDVSPASYQAGHIPGAVLWDIYKNLKDAQYRLVDRAAVEQLFERSGIEPHTRVVLYGYGPALGYWLLKLYRHPRASILNVSKQRWNDDGRPLTTDLNEPNQTRYELPDADDAVRVLWPTVSARIASPDCAILDVRSEAEFRGERFWPSGAIEAAGRAGRIPGAIRVAPEGLVNADGSFAPPDALRAAFPSALAEVSEIVTYCTIGNRASIAWFVLTELLGYSNVRVYDGSWAEWGHLAAVPVDVG